MVDRPAPDPAKLLSQWDDWERGDELPGRTMANLKTGEARQLLEALSSAAGEGQVSGGGAATPRDGDNAALLEAWQGWEKGRTVPADVLAALRDGGFRDLLVRLVG